MMNIWILILKIVLIWQAPCKPGGQVLIDQMQNTYVLNETSLVKYDQLGETHFTYSNLRKGEIHSVDVSNPLRILVHYADNNELIFLDNTLSEQGASLNFNSFGFYDVNLVCSSFQNHLWVYKVSEQKLVRLNKQGALANETANISLFTEEELNFTELHETGNYLYLVNNLKTVLIFDQYGSFIKQLKFPNAKRFHFVDDQIIYATSESIFTYDHILHTDRKILELDSLHNSQFVNVDFNLRNIAVKDSSMLKLYSFE